MAFLEKLFKSQRYLVFDIGTESIKGGVFSKDKKNNFVGNGLFHYDFRNSILFEGISSDLYFKTVEKVIGDFIETFFRKNYQGAYFYSNVPAFFSKYFVIDVHIKRPKKEKIINEKEKVEINKKIFDIAMEDVLKNYMRDTDRYTLGSYSILSYNILGYEVRDLLNKKGEDIGAKIVIFFVDKRFEDIFKSIASKYNFKFISFLNPIVGLRKIGKKNVAYFDVGGLTTECFYFSNYGLENVGVFNFGGYSITKELSRKLGISYNSAKELKEKYSVGNVSEPVKERLEVHISSIIDIWVSEIKEYFIRNNILNIEKIILYGGGARLGLFAKKLESEFDISCEFLTPKDLSGVYLGEDLEINNDLQYTNLLLSLRSIYYNGKKSF